MSGRFTFTGRWRGRRTWVFFLAASLSIVLAVALMWYLPARHGEENVAAGARQGETGLSGLTGTDAGYGVDQPQNGIEPGQDEGQSGADSESGQSGGKEGSATSPNTPSPTPGGDSPGLVVEFPDPTGGGDEPPPAQVHDSILGDWILDMSGSAYGITNCHIRLEENGKIATPPEYEQVFVIKESEYVYEAGTASFAAGMLVMVKLAASQSAVPAEIYLVGQVGKGFTEITGEFVAEPQGEAYSPYAQRGTFSMRRLP
ncbi:MAG: hypothetical protein HPY75_12510 [Actinobacteria bacterium]|nr:hypothetical protein [Actinomycetota bacterium]